VAGGGKTRNIEVLDRNLSITMHETRAVREAQKGNFPFGSMGRKLRGGVKDSECK
jgi:hypothetical protein